MYEYRLVEVLRVVDGDTIDCRIDFGFGVQAKFRFRLAFIDTPEVYGSQATAKGKEASEFTKQWLADHPTCTVRTFKGTAATVGIGDGSFGRWLGAFVSSDGSDLTTALTNAGFA